MHPAVDRGCGQGQKLNRRLIDSQTSKCDPHSDNMSDHHTAYCPLQQDSYVVILQLHLWKVGNADDIGAARLMTFREEEAKSTMGTTNINPVACPHLPPPCKILDG